MFIIEQRTVDVDFIFVLRNSRTRIGRRDDAGPTRQNRRWSDRFCHKLKGIVANANLIAVAQFGLAADRLTIDLSAVAALQILEVPPSSAHFLALPDQGLTDLLTSDCEPILERFATSISSWVPTDLLVPSIHDTHPDHSALAVMLRLAKLYSDETSASVWAYAVHGKSKAFFGRAQELQHSKGETSVKERAIRCHKTQLKLSRRRFLAYALRPECFLKLKSCESTLADGPIRSISRQPDVLRLRFVFSTKLVPAAEATIFVLGRDAAGQVRCVRMRIPVRSSAVEVFDCRTRERVCVAQYRGSALAGEFAVPLDIFSSAHALFAKVEHRSWFFDEAGWLEVAPVVTRTTPARIDRTQSMGTEVLS